MLGVVLFLFLFLVAALLREAFAARAHTLRLAELLDDLERHLVLLRLVAGPIEHGQFGEDAILDGLQAALLDVVAFAEHVAGGGRVRGARIVDVVAVLGVVQGRGAILRLLLLMDALGPCIVRLLHVGVRLLGRLIVAATYATANTIFTIATAAGVMAVGPATTVPHKILSDLLLLVVSVVIVCVTQRVAAPTSAHRRLHALSQRHKGQRNRHEPDENFAEKLSGAAEVGRGRGGGAAVVSFPSHGHRQILTTVSTHRYPVTT